MSMISLGFGVTALASGSLAAVTVYPAAFRHCTSSVFHRVASGPCIDRIDAVAPLTSPLNA